MLHQVGVSFDLYYDARKHKIKIVISHSTAKNCGGLASYGHAHGNNPIVSQFAYSLVREFAALKHPIFLKLKLLSISCHEHYTYTVST